MAQLGCCLIAICIRLLRTSGFALRPPLPCPPANWHPSIPAHRTPPRIPPTCSAHTHRHHHCCHHLRSPPPHWPHHRCLPAHDPPPPAHAPPPRAPAPRRPCCCRRRCRSRPGHGPAAPWPAAWRPAASAARSQVAAAAATGRLGERLGRLAGLGGVPPPAQSPHLASARLCKQGARGYAVAVGSQSQRGQNAGLTTDHNSCRNRAAPGSGPCRAR